MLLSKNHPQDAAVDPYAEAEDSDESSSEEAETSDISAAG
jgi:hypothetical protein